MTFYGMTAAEAERAIALTREYFVPKGMFENELYAGVPELLDATRRAGCVNVMATSKPEPFARQIAAHFGIDTRFELISGSSLDGSRTTKAEVIGHALRTLGITPEEAVMIGDRRHDIYGAHANGLEAIGVLYGYGSREELTAAGAAVLAETVEELHKLLLG